jgi:hypothetical protein
VREKRISCDKNQGAELKVRLFRFLWRANAVLIFTAGVVALICLAVALIHMLRWPFRDREVRAVVNTDQKQQVDESLSLGSPQNISGNPWVLLPLESDQTYDHGSFSKSAQAVRNYAFVSPTEATRWLYPHNRFLVLHATLLPDADYNDEQPTALISFEVVEKDTDGDARLTRADSARLVFTRPDGSGLTGVLDDVQGTTEQTVVGEDILVIYKNSTGFARVVFSLKDFSRLREEKLEYPTGN